MAEVVSFVAVLASGGEPVLATLYSLALIYPFLAPGLLSVRFATIGVRAFPRGWTLHLVLVACALPYLTPGRILGGALIVVMMGVLIVTLCVSVWVTLLLVRNSEQRPIERRERFRRAILGCAPYLLLALLYLLSPHLYVPPVPS